MSNKLRKVRKDENGMIMIETLIVFTVTIFLLFFILAIFSVMYQRWNIQTIANETAAKISQTYRFKNEDLYDTELSKSDITSVKHYRYFFGSKKDLANQNKMRVNDYAKNRLARTTYTIDVSEPTITYEIKSDSLARRHVELTIEGEYSVPFGDMLAYFGFDSTIKYKTTAYAECVDLIDFMNTVDFVDNFVDMDSKAIKLIDSFTGLLNTIFQK